MANNRNPKGVRKPAAVSLLQRAANGAREAAATLEEIRADVATAKTDYNRAMEALNEAKRMLDIQQARFDAQSQCLASYLQDVHNLSVGGLESIAAGGSGEIPG